MQCAKRPQDTGRCDGRWIAIVDRAPSLRLPWLQYAVRSLRPCHQAHLERSSGGLRGRLRELRSQSPQSSTRQQRRVIAQLRFCCRSTHAGSSSYISGVTRAYAIPAPCFRTPRLIARPEVAPVFRTRSQGHWDRNRARPAVGEGFPLLLFRLQDGFTVSPWLTFPEAPL